jgi:hypothetical protein
MKAWRLHPDVVKAIETGMAASGFSEETAYVETVLRLALGLPVAAPPRIPRIKKKALIATP